MKHIKLFEKFEEEVEKKTINDYPKSVYEIYKRFSTHAQKSIDDNLDKFAKIAKRVYYSNKNWKEYFKDKKVIKLNTLNDIVYSLEKWMNKKPTK